MILTLIQLIPASSKSDKHINIAGIDKTYSRCDCNNGSIVNGIRESILFSFAIDKPQSLKMS